MIMCNVLPVVIVSTCLDLDSVVFERRNRPAKLWCHLVQSWMDCTLRVKGEIFIVFNVMLRTFRAGILCSNISIFDLSVSFSREGN